jgi:hypothetical protein
MWLSGGDLRAAGTKLRAALARNVGAATVVARLTNGAGRVHGRRMRTVPPSIVAALHEAAREVREEAQRKCEEARLIREQSKRLSHGQANGAQTDRSLAYLHEPALNPRRGDVRAAASAPAG